MTEQHEPEKKTKTITEKNEEQISEPQHLKASQHIDVKFLELLVCPLTKTSLEYDKENQELISRVARLAYPIREGIPIMSPEEARKLEDD